MAERRRRLHHHPRRTQRFRTPVRRTKSASNSSSNSGSAAIPTPIPRRTPSRKNTIAASRTRTSTSLPAFRAGSQTAAEFTSCGGRPTKLNRTRAAAATTGPPAKAAATTSTYPFEDWRYRYLEGIGEDVNIEFVDPTMTGEFHLTMDPSEKDALTYVPGAGLTQMESMGLASKTDRFSNTDGTHTAAPLGMRPEKDSEFSRLELIRQDSAGTRGEIQRPRSGGHFAPGERPGEIRLPV